MHFFPRGFHPPSVPVIETLDPNPKLESLTENPPGVTQGGEKKITFQQEFVETTCLIFFIFILSQWGEKKTTNTLLNLPYE